MTLVTLQEPNAVAGTVLQWMRDNKLYCGYSSRNVPVLMANALASYTGLLSVVTLRTVLAQTIEEVITADMIIPELYDRYREGLDELIKRLVPQLCNGHRP